MRLVFVHAEAFAFESRRVDGPDGADATGSTVPGEAASQGSRDDCLTVFVTVEAGDEVDVDAVLANARSEIEDVTGQLDATEVVLYPSEHLSDDPAESGLARRVLRGLERALPDSKYDVVRVPFGWGTRFELVATDHPFSKQSRRVDARRDTDDRSTGEWLLVRRDGSTGDPRAASTDLSPELQAFLDHELEDGDGTPTAWDLSLDPLREAGFVGPAEQSPPGHPGLSPRGRFVRDALTAAVEDRVLEYGAIPVETQTTVDRTDDTSAGIAGPLLDGGDLAVENLPITLYDVLRLSCGRDHAVESSTERCSRRVAVPTVQTVTTDERQAREEALAGAGFVSLLGETLGVDYEPVVRTDREWFGANEGWIETLASELDTELLVALADDGDHRHPLTIEFVTVESVGNPPANPSVGIDLAGPERLCAPSDDATRHHPTVHCAPVGSLEGIVASVLASAAVSETPELPGWLSPTQVRLVPVVPDDHGSLCDDLADALGRGSVRVDVDDRAMTVGERIQRTERDWVPYYAVVGDDELEGEQLGVTVRTENTETEMTADALRERVLDDVAEFPGKRQYLPRHLSEHPSVVR